jgi:hypothetical protein
MHATGSRGHFVAQREILGDKVGCKEKDAILQVGASVPLPAICRHLRVSSTVSQTTKRTGYVYVPCYEKWIPLSIDTSRFFSLCDPQEHFFLRY